MEDLITTDTNSLSEFRGSFVNSLTRNNKKIREDRAIAIVESAEMTYKRFIEDTVRKIKQLVREREGMLDLSPETSQSLVLKSDFDENDFVKKDVEMSLKLRDLRITLEIAQARYKELFEGPATQEVLNRNTHANAE